MLSGLMMAERRQRVDAVRRHQLADFLHDLPLEVDRETTTPLWDATQRLAEHFRLTVYDAIYLELAQRKNLALASLDKELCSAAAGLGVPVLGQASP
jgi:predicted nucleic acid-binding protein